MKKTLNTKNNIIIVLCFTIICMSIGFIIISTNKETNEYSYNVVFSDVVKTNTLKGSNNPPISSAKIINMSEIVMNFTMYAPHDEVSYTAHIENKGNIPCEIVDIIESPNYNDQKFKNMIDPVTIKLSDIKGKIIPPEETLDLKIVAYYNSTNKEIIPKNFEYKIGLITRSR